MENKEEVLARLKQAADDWPAYWRTGKGENPRAYVSKIWLEVYGKRLNCCNRTFITHVYKLMNKIDPPKFLNR